MRKTVTCQGILLLLILSAVIATALDVRKPVKTSEVSKESISSVSFSPDGKYMATAPDGIGSFILWNAKTLRIIKVLDSSRDCAKYVTAFSPDSTLVAAGVTSRGIYIWNTASGKLVKVIKAHGEARIQMLAFTPNGRYLVSTASVTNPDERGCIWKTSDWSLKHNLRYDYNHLWVNAMAVSPDSRYVVIAGGSDASRDQPALMYDIESGRMVREFVVFVKAKDGFQGGSINGVYFSPTGNQVASVTQFHVKGFDAGTGRLQFRVETGVKYAHFRYACYTNDGKYIAALYKNGRDYCVHIIDARSGSIVRTFKADRGRNYYYNIFPALDDKYLVLVGTSKTVDFYEWL